MLIFTPRREAVAIHRAKPFWLLSPSSDLDATDTGTKESLRHSETAKVCLVISNLFLIQILSEDIQIRTSSM